MTERVEFFLRFILEPQKVGSITPSSSFLTKRMLSGLAWSDMDTIVELGAGTGVFTRFIADHKPAGCQVVVVEQNNAMRQALREQYPAFYFGNKAEQLEQLLERYQLGPADCIVSGLPFAAFPRELREAVLLAVHHALKPGGIFIAFQYSMQMRKTLKQNFSAVKVAFVPLNIPPAFVYFCRK